MSTQPTALLEYLGKWFDLLAETRKDFKDVLDEAVTVLFETDFTDPVQVNCVCGAEVPVTQKYCGECGSERERSPQVKLFLCQTRISALLGRMRNLMLELMHIKEAVTKEGRAESRKAERYEFPFAMIPSIQDDLITLIERSHQTTRFLSDTAFWRRTHNPTQAWIDVRNEQVKERIQDDILDAITWIEGLGEFFQRQDNITIATEIGRAEIESGLARLERMRFPEMPGGERKTT